MDEQLEEFTISDIQLETDKRYLGRVVAACGSLVAFLWIIFLCGQVANWFRGSDLVSITPLAGQISLALLGVGLVAQSRRKLSVSLFIACIVCFLMALQPLGLFPESALESTSVSFPLAEGMYDALSMIVVITAAVILLVYSLSGPRSFYSPSLSLLGVMIALLGFISLIVISFTLQAPDGLTGIGIFEALSYSALGIGCAAMAWRHFVQSQFTHQALARAIVVYTNFGVCLVALITSIFVTLPFYSHLQDMTNKNLAEVAEFKANSLEQFFSRVRAEAKYVMVVIEETFGDRLRLSREHVLAQASTEDKELLKSLLEVGHSLNGYRYYSAAGQTRLQFGDNLTLEADELDFSRSYNFDIIGPVLDETSSYFALIKSQKFKGQVIGQHVFRISPRPVRRILEDSDVSMHVNASYLRAHSSSGERYFRYSPQTFELQRLQMESMGIMEIQGNNHRIEKRRRKFFATAPIGDSQLSIVLFTDTSDLYSMLRNRSLNFALIALGVGLLASLGMYFLTNEFKKRLLALEFVVDEGAIRNKAILAGAPDAMAILYGNMHIESVNHAFERMIGTSQDEVQGKSLETYLHFDKPSRTWFPGGGYAATSDEIELVKGEVRRGGDGGIPIECTVSKLALADGLRYLVFIRDVSEAYEAQVQMAESLKEKEVLLKEIHHRVKNNLQVISSLLKLQSRGLESEQVRVVFEESQDRIRSIALLHELLYQSQSLSAIPFQNYLEHLSDKLISSYGVGERVVLEIAAGDIELPLDIAMPCGLIVNELVTNAIKHAFGKDAQGKIRIEGAFVSESIYQLSVSDNGRGIDLDRLKEHRGLGTKLITNLVTQ
ncbi:MAG: PAS domain S-box protein, partial [Bdellovibrionales bacterium]|nr:PAS domain S-box protein [Bdellovibrionales bacterium]